MNINDYIAVTVMAAVWIILQIAKAVIGKESDVVKYFPLVAAVLGVLFVFWINGSMDFSLFLQGIASGFAATGLNEGINAIFFNNTAGYNEDEEGDTDGRD